MNHSEFSYLYELSPPLREKTHSIGVRSDPSINNPESYAAILFFECADGTRVEVAKVDNSPHDEGDVHVDRYYRELGAEVKDFDVDFDSWVDAERHLTDNWQRFARLYDEHHGMGVREDGENA